VHLFSCLHSHSRFLYLAIRTRQLQRKNADLSASTAALVSSPRRAFLNSMSPPGSGFPRGFTAHVKLNPQTQSPELASHNVGTAFDPRPCDDLHVISQGPKDRAFRGGKKAEAEAVIAAQQTHHHVFAAWVMWCVKYLVRWVDTATETSATDSRRKSLQTGVESLGLSDRLSATLPSTVRSGL